MKFERLIWALLLLPLALSCSEDDFSPSGTSGSTDPYVPGHREAVEQVRNVMIMVSGGRNSLSGYLTDDLYEMADGYLPEGTAAETNAFVVLSRLPVNSLSTTRSSALFTCSRVASGIP